MTDHQLRALTLTIRISKPELERAHAIAAAGDETISRYIRRTINREYEMRFGHAPPPARDGISYDEKKVGS